MKIHLLTVVAIALIMASCTVEPSNEEIQINLLQNPAEPGASLPFLSLGKDALLLAWVQKENDSLSIMRYAQFSGSTWSSPREIARGHDWFVNWADFPMIAQNASGITLAHFLAKSADATYAYDIHTTLSNGDGVFNSNDFVLNTDSTQTEHGFVTMLPASDSSFFITWLDGRNTVEDADVQAMNLRAGWLTNDGLKFDEDLLDHKTCDCCQTGAAFTTNGPVVVYRDRTDDEIRDISIVRKVAGKWTDPVTVYADNWKINGCPVNGPKVAASGNLLSVAWFTAAEGVPKVQIAFSEDAGQTFQLPTTVNTGAPIGRVGLVMDSTGRSIVSWMESNDGIVEIKVMAVNSNGHRSSAITVAQSNASRATGFPQIALTQDKLMIAWTDIAEETPSIKTAFINTRFLKILKDKKT